MRNGPALFLIAISVTVVAACGGTKDPGDDDASPTEPEATVRDVDFSQQTWQHEDQEVVPEGGADQMGRAVKLGEDTVYTDLDGDGAEDAVVSLATEDGNGHSETWYAWVWDEESGEVAQASQPLARAARCGDVVDSIRPADGGGVTIREYLRVSGDPASCADYPSLEVEREVVVDDGWPMLASSPGGFGGLCPQPEPGDAELSSIEESQELHSAPDDDSPSIDSDGLKWLAMVDNRVFPWLQVDGWHLVGIGPSDGYVRCAWVETP